MSGLLLVPIPLVSLSSILLRPLCESEGPFDMSMRERGAKTGDER